MSSIKQPPKYHMKRGVSNKSNHSSFMNQSDMRARYKKKLIAVLQKNKFLAKALGEAKARIRDLESARSRQQKIDNLALPQIKMWLETNLQFMHTMATNHSRGVKLIEDILTPGQDITLTGISDMELSYSQDRRQSLHPPGRQTYEDFENVTVIPEESESMIDKSEHPLDSAMIEEDPEVNPCSKVTVRRKSRSTRSSAGRRSSLLAATPVAPDVDEDSDSAVPTFKVVDEEASILLREVTGQEKTVVCAESVVLPPPDKVQGPSVTEYSAAFSYRPKIPRTPDVTNKETNCFSEDFYSSPLQMRQRTRLSDIPLQPWPRKSETVRQHSRNARRSGPADFSPSVCPSPLSSRAMSERAFIESPTSTLRRQDENLASLETASPIDLDAPIVEVTSRRQSARKSCMSRPSDAKKSSRVTFVVNKTRETMAAARQAPQDLTTATAECEEAQKAPRRATYFISKSEGKADALQHEGLGDVQPHTANTEARVVERERDSLEKKQIEGVGVVEKDVPQKSDSLPKKARHTGKKSRSKSREVSPAESEPPRKSNGPPNPEPMDVGATSSTDEDGATRSSTGRPCRRNVPQKSYKEPSIHTKLRRP